MSKTYGIYTEGITGHLAEVTAELHDRPDIRFTGLNDIHAAHDAAITRTALNQLDLRNTGATVRFRAVSADAPPPNAVQCRTEGLILAGIVAILAAADRARSSSAETTAAFGRPAETTVEEPGSPPQVCGTPAAAIAARAAKQAGLNLVVADANGPEARTEHPEAIVVTDIHEIIRYLTSGTVPEIRNDLPVEESVRTPRPIGVPPEQLRALEVAAAGGHSIHCAGTEEWSAPVYGRLLRDLLPDLPDVLSRETTAIHSTAGMMRPWAARVTTPPLRAPHFSCSLGAATGTPGRPGEVNLAHNGVLTIDNPSDFKPEVLEATANALKKRTTSQRRMPDGSTASAIPAHFRLIVTTHKGEIDSEDPARTRRAARILDHCEIEIAAPATRHEPDPSAILSARDRVAKAFQILHSPPEDRANSENTTPRDAAQDRLARTIAALDGRSHVTQGDRLEAATLTRTTCGTTEATPANAR